MAIDERELDDSALVEAAQRGDHDAFAELFRRHYPTVRRVCARRFGNATEADEVAQAAFVRAYERLHQCEGERRFGAWVQVIAFNLGADARRHHARSLLTDEPMVGDAALGPNHCEDHILRAERVAEVRELLDTLPPRQREVIIARDMEGQRPGEIAASLGLSLGAVDSLLLRARRRMALVWRTTGPEQGAASVPATAAAAATTAAATAHGPISSGVGMLSNALASLSYRVASTLGIVPGGSGRAAGALVGGALVAGTIAAPAVIQPATAPAPTAPPALAIVLPAAPASLPTVTTLVSAAVPPPASIQHPLALAPVPSLPQVAETAATLPTVTQRTLTPSSAPPVASTGLAATVQELTATVQQLLTGLVTALHGR